MIKFFLQILNQIINRMTLKIKMKIEAPNYKMNVFNNIKHNSEIRIFKMILNLIIHHSILAVKAIYNNRIQDQLVRYFYKM